MIKKIGRRFLWVVGFFILFMLLLPKTQLWYALEHKIKDYGVIIHDEVLNEHLSTLDINEGTLYFGNMELSRIENATISLWLFYNKLSLQNLYFGKSLKMLQGIRIEQARITHHLFSPMSLSIDATGSFGSLQGSIDLLERKILLTIQASPLLQKKTLLIRMLQKTKEGYVYAKTF